MNNLFGLLVLALTFLAPVSAQAVNCFWVGGSATWDTTNTGGGGSGGIKWASATGGTTPCSGGGTGGSPSSSDIAIFDASSGGGTVTVNYGGTVTLSGLTFGAFTGTLDFATNDNPVTVAGNVSGTGTGTRTFNMGDGTWSLSNNNSSWQFSTVTNLTFNANGSTIAFTGSAPTGRSFEGGGLTYNIVTVNAIGTGSGQWGITGGNTFGTLTIAAPNRIALPNSVTQTVTTLTNITGSSSQQVLFLGNLSFGAGTISSGSTWTCTWCAFTVMTFSGAGTFTAPNSFNFGGNTNIAITSPSGAGGGGRIIGG